jgi:2'-5' RNA ligase
VGADALGQTGVGLRAFFGLPVPEPHREALGGYLEECASRAPDFRWTPADNLHLTLRFLGQVEESTAQRITDALSAASLRGFDLELGEGGAFKRGRLTRVMWLGLRRGSEEIGQLAAIVEAESVSAGLEPEGRRFHAHLTLARARPRDGAPLPELPLPPALPAWYAGELILYRSRLGRGGSVYEPVRTLTLD